MRGLRDLTSFQEQRIEHEAARANCHPGQRNFSTSFFIHASHPLGFLFARKAIVAPALTPARSP